MKKGLNNGSGDAPLAVSVYECCRRTSIGRTKVFELLRDGKLQSCQIGRRRLVLWSSVEALFHANDGE